ncbi:tetratricopeptide repeat protein [Pinirhizobacter soli]|uniref:tetratricopeptide repeat protein n=1 Tax=Pinirhizobacter soli TaxID=2786953 RepID=UPI00202A9D1E|nr:tetratricopeptide repeat protein [Pinirhizobacter soli]
MEMRQHRRRLWIGLAACAITPPMVYLALVKLTLLRFPFLMAPAQAYMVMALIFLVVLILSSVATFSIGLLAVTGLKKVFRLNAVYVCGLGVLTGALLGSLLNWTADFHTTAMTHLPLPNVLNRSLLGAMVMPAWVGLTAAVVLCLVSGIPIRSVRRGQMVDGALSPSVFKQRLAFSVLVVALSTLMLRPFVAPFFLKEKLAFPNMPTAAPRSVDAKSWDRTCPKEYASPEDPTIELVDTDVAQLAIETSEGDTTAQRKLTQFAESGNQLAQYKLGKIYNFGCHDGSGVPRDAARAAQWFELAARQGSAEAASELGVIYYRGDLPSKGPALSVYWFNQANTLGYRDAMVVHGQLIRKVIVNGLPAWPAEVKDTVAQTEVLAEQGDAEAQEEMGEMIEQGMAGPIDFALAASWFQKSAMKGNAVAQRNLGLLYMNGWGVTRDTTQTLSWLTNAATQNDAIAADKLGSIYLFGLSVPKDATAAAHWYSVAAEHGSVAGQGSLATAYMLGRGLPKDDVKAWQWFLVALAHSENVAIFAYDDLRRLRTTMPPDQLLAARQAAREWWRSHSSLSSSSPLH